MNRIDARLKRLAKAQEAAEAQLKGETLAHLFYGPEATQEQIREVHRVLPELMVAATRKGVAGILGR